MSISLSYINRTENGITKTTICTNRKEADQNLQKMVEEDYAGITLGQEAVGSLALKEKQQVLERVKAITYTIGEQDIQLTVHVLVDSDDCGSGISATVYETEEKATIAYNQVIIDSWENYFGKSCPVADPKKVTQKMIDKLVNAEHEGEAAWCQTVIYSTVE